MGDEIQKGIDGAGEIVDRAREEIENFSKQPRFAEDITDQVFTSILRWVDDMETKEPPYEPNSRKRDEWLRAFLRKEPHLHGVVNGVVAVDKNRGWSMIGGRNQVIRFTDVLHNWQAAPGLYGYRGGQSAASMSFYTSDLGALIEIGRDGVGGPMRALYHVDPVRCALTGDGDQPLRYYPLRGKMQNWSFDDFLRIASLPSTDETYKGLGLCAVSRASELSKLMVAVMRHDSEQLGARAPRGLLLLKGIQQATWDKAMQARDAALTGENWKYYDAIAVLASGATDVDAKMVALSQLPVGFERKTFVDLIMFGYALIFGYDPIEFWPVQFGAIGRGNESQIQHDKATGKGGLDYALGFQEQLQENLPDTLQFEIDQRDQDADLVLAQIHQAWGDAIGKIAQFVTADEARLILAEHEIIPREWTEQAFDASLTAGGLMATKIAGETEQEDDETEPGSNDAEKGDVASSATDKKQKARRPQVSRPGLDPWKKRERDRVREKDFIWRVGETFPSEPIVRYDWPSGRTSVLWNRGEEIFDRVFWPGAAIKRRAAESEVLYDEGDVTITGDDVTRAISEAGRRVSQDMADALDNEPISE